jgi:hypothetical protein
MLVLFIHPGDLSLDLDCLTPFAFLALIGLGVLLFRLGRRYFK